MNLPKNYLTYVLISGALLLSSCMEESIVGCETSSIETQQTDEGQIIPGKYIVTLKEGVVNNRNKRDMSYLERTETAKNASADFVENVTGLSCEIEHAYHSAISGFSAVLTEEQVEKLKNNPKVLFVEQDRIIMAAPPEGKGPKNKGGNEEPQDPQRTPWGISRVLGTPSNYTGENVAWILDSGIDLDHPDLNVDVSRSASFLGGRDKNNPDDENGHGTHVAGTVAAINNDFGVIGVAPGATVISVRVLDRRGYGSYSGIIAGIDYVKANGVAGDVANMSLTGGGSSALDLAVQSAAAKGIHFCLAAGNDYGNANSYSPARTNGNYIYTVSAMGANDVWANFSNSGNPPIDYCEPGVDIESCWRNGGYNTISGTSMATPHLAGILLMTGGSPVLDGQVIGDPDGTRDNIAIVN